MQVQTPDAREGHPNELFRLIFDTFQLADDKEVGVIEAPCGRDGLIGLSTYSFFWEHPSRVSSRLSLDQMVGRAVELGAGVFQICDFAAVEGLDEQELKALAFRASEGGLRLELGTRGIRPNHLARYLDLARQLDASIVRSMVFTADDRPSLADAASLLAEIIPEYAAAGVSLALETYEQLPTKDLVALVEKVASSSLGICLDPANCVASLEHPDDVIERTADHVVNLHVKDFAFSRQDGWVGFVLAGTRLGEGLLDLDHLFERVRPAERGISQIIEHWLPWQGDEKTTVARERDWTQHNLDYLRRKSS